MTDQQQLKHMDYPQLEIAGHHWSTLNLEVFKTTVGHLGGEGSGAENTATHSPPWLKSDQAFSAPLARNDFHQALQMLSK